MQNKTLQIKACYSLLAISLCLLLILNPFCMMAVYAAPAKPAPSNSLLRNHHQRNVTSKRLVNPGTLIARSIAPRPIRPVPSSSTGIEIELKEGTEQLEKPAQNKVVVASSLPAERVAALLKRLPEAVAPTKSGEFNIPFATSQPPKPGKIVNMQFPPKDAAAPPAKPEKKLPPFAVLRKSPEGTLSNVGQLSVTFSQAMVPIAEAESEVLSSNIPVHITPEPKGKWRWLGTQTLVFTPDAKHFPHSTIYKVDIAKGTKSAVGGTLDKAVSWNITVPAASVIQIYPRDTSSYTHEEPRKLDQMIVVQFDQQVDPKKILPVIHVSEGKNSSTLRLASEKEIADDSEAAAMTKSMKKGTWVAVRANALFQKKQHLKVSIGPNIPSLEGPLVQQGTWDSKFMTFWPLDVRTTNNAYAPSANMSIEFNNPIAEKQFKSSMVSIKPEVPNLQVTWSGHYVTLAGSFKANTKYDVTLDKSIPDVFGQTLGTTKTVNMFVGTSGPQLVTPDHPMAVLQPSKKPSFSFLSSNLQQVKVNVYQTAGPQDYRKYLKSHQELQQWHEKVDQYRDLQGFKLLSSKVISLPKSDEEFSESTVDLAPHLKNGLGHVIVTAEKWPRKKDEVQRFSVWLQCTRLGIDAFTDGATLVTLATKLEDGSPVSDVQVSVEGKDPLSGKTDKAGVSRLPLVHGNPSILFCKQGDDEAFLPNSPYAWVNMPYENGTPDKNDMLRWYCVTDRQLYRPSEKVEVKGWVRRFGAGPKGDIGLVAASRADAVDYQIYDAQGVEITKGKSKLDAAGAYNFSFEIPKTANLGSANIQFNASSSQGGSGYSNGSWTTAFKIEEFRRPEFELSVKSSKGNSMIFGESANLLATANYFSGGPLPDAPIHWDVQTSSSSYSPPGWSDFVFGKQVSYFCFYDYPGVYMPPLPGSAASASFDGKTDGNGKHVLDLKIKKLAEDSPVSIVAEGTVTDVNRQQWTDKATILLHPADVYVGIRSLKQFYKADEQVKMESVVTDLDGKAVSGRSVQLEVVRTVQTVKENVYKSEEEKLGSINIQSDSKPAAWNLDIAKGGSMKIVAVVTDASGRKNKSELTFWKEEKQPEAQRKVEQGKILVIADQKKYKPGETAELMIQAPFAGGKGVVTVRHNGLSNAIPVSFSESAGSVKIPITEDMMPNASVQIDIDGPNCSYASGTLDLSVPADSRTIAMEVSPAEKAVSPGGQTKLSIKLKDEKGNALANAQVAVAVVDESILALAGYNWEDPISTFYSTTSPNTNDFHTRSVVLLTKPPKNDPREFSRRKAKAESASMMPPPSAMPMAPMPGGAGGAADGAAFGGMMATRANSAMDKRAVPQSAMAMDSLEEAGAPGGGPSTKPIAMRTDFNALAYFNPSLNTDSNGTVTCDVKVPDNLTRYRIMAVAVSGEKLCGKGESTLVARLPLMVRPSAPRFLNFGDKCELPVVLQNQTDHEMSVDLGLRAANLRLGPSADPNAPPSNNAGLDLAHTSGGNVLVPPNDRVEVRFPVSTEDDGTATVDIAAACQDFADAAKVTLPVYTPATTHAFATYGQIDEGGVDQTVEIPKDVFDQIGGLELSTSSTNLQSLTDAYIYLHDYSFACSEQLSSRILATTALQDVLQAFGKMTPAEITKTKAQIQDEINELCKRQNDDGSFGLWKRGEHDYWPFVSIQVARALHEAKVRKYDVPEAAFHKTKEFLKNIESHLTRPHYDEYTRRSLVAYALFVRHLMGDSQPGIARRLIQNSLASYDSNEHRVRRGPDLPNPGLSQQDKMLQVFSMETLGWLLPVISADKSSANETSTIRAVISSHIKETASKAEVVDDGYGEYDYCVFWSFNRLNATMLEALILDQPKNDVIAKLANSILAHRRAGRWESTQENCASILALSRYFNTYEKQVPDFVANTWLGNQYVGANKFVGRSTDTQVTNVPMRFLMSHQQDKDVVIAKTGKGRLYYRLALNYAPKELLLKAYDNGFGVTRTYEAVDDPADVKKDSNGVWHFKAGATVKAKIEITAPGSRYHVALTDPLPAGMEPINASLAGNRSLSTAKKPDSEESTPEEPTGIISETNDSDTEGFSSWRWNPWWWNYSWYQHQNLRDFRAEAFTSNLWSGKFNYSYLMRATTPGDYIVPPTKVEEMYTPETFGRAASEHVIVE